jgi:hypothetical protein
MSQEERYEQSHIKICHDSNCDTCLNILVQNFIELIKINTVLEKDSSEKNDILSFVNKNIKKKINNTNIYQLIKTTNENKRDSCSKLLKKFETCKLDLHDKRTLFKNITEVVLRKPSKHYTLLVNTQLETYGYNISNECIQEIVETIFRQTIYTIIVNCEYNEEFMNCKFDELKGIGILIIAEHLRDLDPYICAISTLIAKNKYLK